MKKLTAAVMMGVFCAISAPVGIMPAMANTAAEQKAYEDQYSVLLGKMHESSIRILQAAALFEKATGDKADLRKINQLIKRLDGLDPADEKGFKEINKEIKQIAKGLKKMKFKNRKLSNVDEKDVENSLRVILAAAKVQVEVGKEAARLGDKLAKLAKATVNKPADALQLKEEAADMIFVGNHLGKQAKQLVQISKAIGKFAKAHKIKQPSAREIAQEAKQIASTKRRAGKRMTRPAGK